MIRILKRDGQEVEFVEDKIVSAISKAMEETEKGLDLKVALKIAKQIKKEVSKSENVLDVEDIQDKAEELLSEKGRFDVAKRYILYRSERDKLRKVKKSSGQLLSDDFISKYKHKPSPMGQLGSFVYYRTYSRWLEEEGRREYWYETVRRAVEYNCSLAPTTRSEAEKLYDNIFNLKQFLSGRTLFTGGTDVSKKYGMSNFNCSMTTADDFESFKDLLYLLLIGAGVGLRVRKKDVVKLPSVRGDVKLISKAFVAVPTRDRIEYTSLQYEDDIVEIVVGDSKEGWVQAIDYLLKFFYLKEFDKIKTIIMNYDHIRPHGERLKTFGGFSSGHEPFLTMVEGIYKILVKDNTGLKKLKPIDCMDIANIIGMAVVSGGVRRTSEVILFDWDDEDIAKSKSELYKQDINGNWNIDEDIAHRRMSNNSIQYEKKPSREQWHKHIGDMRFSGEPAFQNLEAAKKRKNDAEGGNPCMEIILRKNQMCNLTEVNVAGFVSGGTLDYEGLYEAQRLSARAGYRMACIDFELYKWDAINKEDMLIGAGLTGWQDMVNAAGLSIDEESKIMRRLNEITEYEADSLADKLGRNRSKLKTTIKPSGTLSQLPGVSSGLHFSHSPYYIRRVRINAGDPLVQVVKELEYPILPEVGQTIEDCDTVVVEFPVKSPEGKTKYDVSAIEQLEIYKRFMDNYVSHNASITIHVREHEWDEVEEWCYENWDSLVAVSFLSLDDSFYQLMPYETITKEEYKKRISKMKSFNPNLLQKYETYEVELDIGESECSGGSCPIR